MFDVSAAVNEWVNGVIERTRKIVDECAREAVRETKSEIEQRLIKAYTQAATDWYGAYTPEYYNRRGSLYNLMSFDDPDDETIEYVISGSGWVGSNPSPPTTLFNKVFVEGWHGGAFDGSTMRYRTGPGFVHWGRRAVRTMSPMILFDEGKKTLEEEYSTILSANVQKKLEERFR